MITETSEGDQVGSLLVIGVEGGEANDDVHNMFMDAVAVLKPLLVKTETPLGVPKNGAVVKVKTEQCSVPQEESTFTRREHRVRRADFQSLGRREDIE